MLTVLAVTLFQASLAANAGDYLTTQAGMQRFGCSAEKGIGAPFACSPISFAAYKATMGVVLPELIARHEDKHGHHRRAKIVRLGAILVPSVLTMTNGAQLAFVPAPGRVGKLR